jgi:hypothetical protein
MSSSWRHDIPDPNEWHKGSEPPADSLMVSVYKPSLYAMGIMANLKKLLSDLGVRAEYTYSDGGFELVYYNNEQFANLQLDTAETIRAKIDKISTICRKLLNERLVTAQTDGKPVLFIPAAGSSTFYPAETPPN